MSEQDPDSPVVQSAVDEYDSDYDSDKGCEGRASDEPFLCGVVEGFYGRPWNYNQRIELFRRMKQLGMNTYLYAPKDDIKHRAYWREMYTVEEAEHLTELIRAALSCDLTFIYAISPGLDMTYSSSKDVTVLKRKLDQVASFGCKAFALLFDDIEPEMNKTDKEIFQSFAHAQSSVTNTMYEHLKDPMFLFCPTEYCTTRAVPTVLNSQYLNTVGEKLLPKIHIMWTGPKVVSKEITPASIKQLTKVIRRPPMIWDNIHANDYDQKRIFLGPFSGRHPALIPLLSGVLTNPNCEFEPNYVAMLTLATWSKTVCEPEEIKVLSPQTKVEREGEIVKDLATSTKTQGSYNGREALRSAIKAWLPIFYMATEPDGGRPPSPKLALAPTPVTNTSSGIPESVTTCMSITPTTQTGGLALSTDQVIGDIATHNSSSPPSEEPMEILPEKLPAELTAVNSLVSTSSSVGDKMQIDEDADRESFQLDDQDRLDEDDVEVICDMFYLPYEHGTSALYLLEEFNWLKYNSHQLHDRNNQRLIDEWRARAKQFDEFNKKYSRIVEKFSKITNRCLLYDLNNYLWDLRGTISLLNSFIKWLDFHSMLDEDMCENMANKFTTWSSPGYSQAFMSGDNEPWVFRGGLTGELQRLLPMDTSDLFNPYRTRCARWGEFHTNIYTIKPYLNTDESAVYDVCRSVHKTADKSIIELELPNLIPDLYVGGLITLNSRYTFILEDESGICGYAVGAPDAKEFHKQMESSWIPEMQNKYPQPAETDGTTEVQEMISEFYNYSAETSEGLLLHHSSLIRIETLPRVVGLSPKQRLIACLFSALKSVKSTGAHCVINTNNEKELSDYQLLGFNTCDPVLLSHPNPKYTVLCRKI